MVLPGMVLVHVRHHRTHANKQTGAHIHHHGTHARSCGSVINISVSGLGCESSHQRTVLLAIHRGRSSQVPVRTVVSVCSVQASQRLLLISGCQAIDCPLNCRGHAPVSRQEPSLPFLYEFSRAWDGPSRAMRTFFVCFVDDIHRRDQATPVLS